MMRTSKTWVVAAFMAVAALTTIAVGSVAARPGDLAIARAATARFHRLAAAESAGYGLPPAGVPLHECISNGSAGAMGFHWINGALLDTTLDPAKPEALVYAPDSRGRLHLAALEFVVFQDAWNTAHPGTMPELFGKMFMPVNAAAGHHGNTVFDIPPFYMLHVWIWNSNPSGMFQPWNPSASCGGAAAAAARNASIGKINASLASATGKLACRIERSVA